MSKQRTASTGRPSSSVTAASPSACGTVRTTPSSSTPLACRGSESATLMMPRMTASGTRSPRSIYAFASSPSGVPLRIAARSSSPVASVGTPSAAASSGACVPFPAPGFPKRTMIIGGGGSWRAACSEPSGRRLTPADLETSLLHEAVVLTEQQVLLHLRQGVQRNTDDDQQRGATERERYVDRARNDDRQERDQREEDRAREGDPADDLVDVLRRLRARLHPRDEPALLLQILRQIDRVEDDRRVEVGEEQDEQRLRRDVPEAARREDVGDPARELVLREELRERAGHDDDRLGEDDRHHPRRVDPEWDEAPRRLAHPSPRHRALRDLDQDAPRRHRHRDDRRDDRDHDRREHDE